MNQHSSVFQRSDVATLRFASLPVLPKVLISILLTFPTISKLALSMVVSPFGLKLSRLLVSRSEGRGGDGA